MSECSFVAGVTGNVIKQIQVREDKFGKSPKTDEELSIIHGNCPWVVLRSGVDAPTDDSDRQRVYLRTGTQPPVTNDWAKKAVLGGELQDRSGTGQVRPAGIQTLRDNAENRFSSIYRLTEYQGHRPVSGITEVTVTSKDTWGMILEAIVKIKCWSQDELDTLDRVYFKPGYAALLEFGHTAYFKEDGSKCITPQLMISDEEFFNTICGSYLYLDQKILERRKQNSNQEAVFGYITNFSFSLNKDGSYDCTLKILSKGSVIPGLKIKNASQFSEDPEDESEDQDEDKVDWEHRSVWHSLYTAIAHTGQTNEKVRGSISSIPEIANPSLEDYRQLPPRNAISMSNVVFDGRQAILVGKEKISNVVLLDLLLDIDGNKRRKQKGTNLFKASACSDLKYGFPVIEVPLKTQNLWQGLMDTSLECGYYITLRSLLYLINVFNSDGKVNFNLWDDATYVDCIHDLHSEPETDKIKIKVSDPDDIFPFPAVSLNPYVAIKPKQGGTYYDIFKEGEDYFHSVVAAERGGDNPPKILNIWINFGQFIYEIDKQLENKVEDYSILDALEGLLGRIQKSFGNINEFKIVTDHRLGDTFFSIIDTKCIDTADRAGQDRVPKIQVTGLNNTVSNLTITSEISSDLVNQMTIAAQAPRAYGDTSENTDEAMIHWGENCQQRWVLPDTKDSGNTGIKPKTEEEIRKEKIEYEQKKRKWIKRLRKKYNKIKKSIHTTRSKDQQEQQEKVYAEAEEKFKDLQLDGERYIHGQLGREFENPNNPNFQMGIIPIRAGLTMMGIGNFTVGNVFKMVGAVILPKYRNWGHIVTGIEHRISRGRWETTLKTQYYPIYTGIRPVVQHPSKCVEQKAVEANANNGVSTQYRIKKDKEAIENACGLYEAMTSAGYTWDGKSHGRCARYTYAWAQAYVLGKEPLYREPVWNPNSRIYEPSQPAYNADDRGHVNMYRSLGYSEVSEMKGVSLDAIKSEAAKCKPGDVLIYYNTDRGGTHMHSQFLSERGWVSDFKQETGCVYSSESNFTVIRLKAPKRSSDWDCSM